MLRPRASYSHLAGNWFQWRGIRLSGFIAFSLRGFVIVSSEICYKGVLLLFDLCPSVFWWLHLFFRWLPESDISEPVDPLLVEQNIIRASAKEIDTRCRLGLRSPRPSGLGRTSQTP